MNQVVPNTSSAPDETSEAYKAKNALHEISKGNVFVPKHDIIRLFESARSSGEDILRDPLISAEIKDVYIESLPVVDGSDLEEIKESILERLVDTMKNFIK